MQCLERLPTFKGDVVPGREQGVPLALDEVAGFAPEPRVLALADLFQDPAQVAQDVDLVEEDGGLWGSVTVAWRKGFPMSITATQTAPGFFSSS